MNEDKDKMIKLDKDMLTLARKQFCLDIGMDWKRYEEESERKVYIQKMTYMSGTSCSSAEGARRYQKRDSFFIAIICMGQLFLGVDEAIYDWAVENFENCEPEWFCKFLNLRAIDHKLQEYGRCIEDTHVYYLPGVDMVYAARGESGKPSDLIWYEQQELLQFKENNRFDSAICFSPTQPDMLAVATLKQKSEFITQEDMAGMAGVSADGKYLWQIGINVDEECRGRGLAVYLVRQLAEEVLRRGKVPFYGTSESHAISRAVAYKAGFLPAFAEIYVSGKR